VGWQAADPERDFGVLAVGFHGERGYVYEDVPQTVLVEMLNAESVGGHFAAHVRGTFDGERVEVEEPA
jgi:hypothetical protein